MAETPFHIQGEVLLFLNQTSITQTKTNSYYITLYVHHKQNIIGSLERTLQYYYHATQGEPLLGSPGAAW